MPDYDSLRRDTPFSWRVGSTYLAVLEASGVDLHSFFLEPEAGVEAYREGRPRIAELFGLDVAPAPLGTPPVSYGHVNCLGAELVFPEGGEVVFVPAASNLDEAIAFVERKVDFATSGMAPFYVDYRRELERAFPGENVGFSFGVEGPITTAYEIRGQDFFMDPLLEPEKCARFLRAATESIVAYRRWYGEMHGLPSRPSEMGLCDDMAAQLGPGLWGEFVAPFWEQYYRGLTDGTRNVHVEGLTAEHLPWLERAGISHFDPSVSPKLTPAAIRDGCRVAFGWRLLSFQFPGMDEAAIRGWIADAVEGGASSVFTYVSATMVNEATVPKVRAFVEAARRAAELLEEGVSREAAGAAIRSRTTRP